MKFMSSLAPLLLVLVFAMNGYGQDPPATAAESLEKLRAQLLELQEKEGALRERAAQLEESLKPENIERSLAGVGSTKPEALRETRRRQLTIERDGVLAQLKIIENGRQRLETAIAEAEARAYHESARPAPTVEIQMLAASTGWAYKWLMFGGGAVAGLMLTGGVLLYRRKIRLR